MTATAFAYDLAFDTGSFGGHQGPTAPRAPRLAVLPGGGTGRVALAPVADPLATPLVNPSVEMYRRRRFMAVLALTAFVLLIAQLSGMSLTSFGPLGDSVDASTPVVHVVAPGDTYGGIAASMGAEHPPSFALELQAINADAELVVGQRLVVDRAALSAASN